MKSFLIITASSPSSPQATRGLQTALDLQSKGHVSLVLMQDAVLAALKDSKTAERVRQLAGNAGSVCVLADHLSKRGFSSDDFWCTHKIAQTRMNDDDYDELGGGILLTTSSFLLNCDGTTENPKSEIARTA